MRVEVSQTHDHFEVDQSRAASVKNAPHWVLVKVEGKLDQYPAWPVPGMGIPAWKTAAGRGRRSSTGPLRLADRWRERAT